jgi:hypothetical protein
VSGYHQVMTEVRAFTARGGYDDRIHIVDAPHDALVDPAPYRARCGERVLEVYNTDLTVTCPACAGE